MVSIASIWDVRIVSLVNHESGILMVDSDSEIERMGSEFRHERELCNTHQVPRTVYQRFRDSFGKVSGSGRKTKFDPIMEQELVNYILYRCDYGFGLDRQGLLDACSVYAEQKKIEFKTSPGWFYRFMNRHPSLAQRRCQVMEYKRTKAMNANIVGLYFELLETWMLEILREDYSKFINDHWDKRLLGNLDEAGFSPNVDAGFIITRTGTRSVQRTGSGKSYHVSTVNCIIANGHSLPLYFIIPGVKRDPVKLKGCEPGVYDMSKSGNLTDALWVEEVVPFLVDELNKYRRKENLQDKWFMLVLDGYGYHTITVAALDMFYTNRILLVSMPSHTSADLQPLDLGVFHPVKQYFRTILRDAVANASPANKVKSKWKLPKFVEAAWKRAVSEEEGIKNTFAKVGLYPFVRNWVDTRSDLFKRPQCFERQASNSIREHMFNCTESEVDYLVSHPSLRRIITQLGKDTGVSGNVIQRIFDRGAQFVKDMSICLPPIKHDTREASREYNINESHATAKVLNDGHSSTEGSRAFLISQVRAKRNRKSE